MVKISHTLRPLGLDLIRIVQENLLQMKHIQGGSRFLVRLHLVWSLVWYDFKSLIIGYHKFLIPYARRYKPRLVHFLRQFLCFQRVVFFHLILSLCLVSIQERLMIARVRYIIWSYLPSDASKRLTHRLTQKQMPSYTKETIIKELRTAFKTLISKGQIKSEWIYEIINFQKMNRKISALRVFIVHRAEILQIFWFIFWKIDDFINPFWLNLTFTKFNGLLLALELIRYLLKPPMTCPPEHTFSVWMDPETGSKSFWLLELIRQNRNCTEILQYVNFF